MKGTEGQDVEARGLKRKKNEREGRAIDSGIVSKVDGKELDDSKKQKRSAA